jgi:hypothetical protein
MKKNAKSDPKKLTLMKNTLRTLTTTNLKEAAGGAASRYCSCCSNSVCCY